MKNSITSAFIFSLISLTQINAAEIQNSGAESNLMDTIKVAVASESHAEFLDPETVFPRKVMQEKVVLSDLAITEAYIEKTTTAQSLSIITARDIADGISIIEMELPAVMPLRIMDAKGADGKLSIKKNQLLSDAL